MLLEALGAAVLGLALSGLAVRALARRLPAAWTVLVSGVAGALFGAYLTHFALGPGHHTLTATLVGAVLVSAVVLSLLLRPAAGAGRAARRAPFSLPSGG
ncbi:hypothetical protein LG632_15635 [Streptomyces sp. SMC 277]|uniref:Integral membrane protein n=1 Tax=Streptomyces antimicrobicus TaxID=2883108 RepID=A0ABS8B8B3_9ACTN|nr:hypothetical protein [Streptomyces antimicrobicus]MCB5180811.1 hypothetical protein [Streptomyces antimicrobicus]